MQVLVGAGGWDYFPTDEKDKLKAYAKLFRFVEVNSTFYSIPRISTVRSWRRRVPRDFVFSVKCNGIATHVHGLKPVDETFKVLEMMVTVCNLLRSDMFVLQTPSALRVDKEKVNEVSSILKNVDMGEVQTFWEIRTPMPEETRKEIWNTMLNEHIMPVVDLAIEEPLEGAQTVYSRIFNHHSIETSEATILEIENRTKRSKAERVVLTFHTISQYTDALRYLDLGR